MLFLECSTALSLVSLVNNTLHNFTSYIYLVGKLTKKLIWRSVILTKQHCVLSTSSSKTHSPGLDFVTDLAL